MKCPHCKSPMIHYPTMNQWFCGLHKQAVWITASEPESLVSSI